ncbi:MAG: HAMP domain-containing protein, partial [Puniceicoccales bacterium]|nr:HAMP domain-containing protein [Puniceicoccales bacterium]
MKLHAPHSIRWRVQVWHGIILLLTIGAYCLTAHRLAWDNQLRRIDTDLERNYARKFLHALTRRPAFTPNGTDAPAPPANGTDAPNGTDAADGTDKRQPPLTPQAFAEQLRQGRLALPPNVATLFQGHDAGYTYFCLLETSTGHIFYQSENAPAHLDLPPAPPVLPDTPPPEITRSIATRREIIRFTHLDITWLIGRDITPDLEAMHRHTLLLAASGAAVWLLGLLGDWWLAGRAIRPIKKISDTATRIAAGNHTERILTDGTANELDQLSHILNQTFDRLHATLERQRQFTADAS